MSTKSKIILDTDPGGDDCFAFLWLISLAKQEKAEIVAVTSVDGNVSAQLTFASSCKLLKLCNFDDVEVGRGVIGGSKRDDIEDAGTIHGMDGLGNLSHTLPKPEQKYESARYSDDILIEKLREFPGEITIVAIAPLTNLAAAEKKSPGILDLAKEIVIMGGAFKVPGNITSEAEFNIAYDPEAAKLIFDRYTHLVILPLDITQNIVFTNEMAEHVAEVNCEHAIAQFIIALCKFMAGTAMAFRETSGLQGFLVHDAATLAYLFYPETLLFRRAQVQIETQGEWTKGKTLYDDRHKTKIGANAWVAMQVDSVNLLAAIVEDLKYLLANV
ncbi:MAG: nucleoside hydrolase [Drouetiella hepatica Uher 2000/2452]|uniref:Nucleoside hydrolase n=1 Tax=Drouetiella hepatica Uher 2000/2452 TaxID=904376 RepID=A0A951QFQ6_9CYAN|nr:nucleoside hydrolase [Drouetiella hepatica Uher 2000/2452]